MEGRKEEEEEDSPCEISVHLWMEGRKEEEEEEDSPCEISVHLWMEGRKEEEEEDSPCGLLLKAQIRCCFRYLCAFT